MILLIWVLSLLLTFVGGMEAQRWVTRRRVSQYAEIARVNQIHAQQRHGRW